MTTIDIHTHSPEEALLPQLEGILVNEFRTCQSLYTLVRQERNLLTNGDVEALNDLIEEKEILLDELGQIEENRRVTIGKIARQFPDGNQITSAVDLFTRVDPATSTRLDRLYTGIGTVINQVRELNNGNQALALHGLNHVDAVQAYLLSIFQAPLDYQPPNAVASSDSVLVYELDQRT